MGGSNCLPSGEKSARLPSIPLKKYINSNNKQKLVQISRKISSSDSFLTLFISELLELPS